MKLACRKNANAVLDASEEVGMEVNAKKTKYMFLSCHQTIGDNHYIKVANKYFDRVQIFGNSSNESKLHSWQN
jgi:hypothetical protein